MQQQSRAELVSRPIQCHACMMGCDGMGHRICQSSTFGWRSIRASAITNRCIADREAAFIHNMMCIAISAY